MHPKNEYFWLTKSELLEKVTEECTEPIYPYEAKKILLACGIEEALAYQIIQRLYHGFKSAEAPRLNRILTEISNMAQEAIV